MVIRQQRRSGCSAFKGMSEMNNWKKAAIVIVFLLFIAAAYAYTGVARERTAYAAGSERVAFMEKTLGAYLWNVESVTGKNSPNSSVSGEDQNVVKLRVTNVSGAGCDITHAVLYLFDKNGDRLLTQDFIIPEMPAGSVTAGIGNDHLTESVDSRLLEIVCDDFSAADVADYTIGYTEEFTLEEKERENLPVIDGGENYFGTSKIKDGGYLQFCNLTKEKSYVMINMAPQMYRKKILGNYGMRVTCNQNDKGTVEIDMTIENTTGKDLAGQYMNLYLYSYKRDKVGQVLAVKVPELGAHKTASLTLETEDIGAVYAFDWNCAFSPDVQDTVTQAPQTGLIDYVSGRKALISRALYIPQKLDGRTVFITSISYAASGNKLEYMVFLDPQEQTEMLSQIGVYFGNRADRTAYAFGYSTLSVQLSSRVYSDICTAYVHSEAEADRIDTMLDEDLFDSGGWKEVSYTADNEKNDGSQGGNTQSSQNIRNLSAHLLDKEYVELRWKGALENDIVILRKTGKKGTYKRYASISSGSLYYADKKVKGGKTYYYKVIPLVNGTYSKEDVARAAEVHVKMPALIRPEISLKRAAAKKYIRIAFTRYEGDYAQIQVKRENGYINVPLKKGKISKYKGIYRLKYSTRGKKLLFRARTWRRKNGKKVYSTYSEVRVIRI